MMFRQQLERCSHDSWTKSSKTTLLQSGPRQKRHKKLNKMISKQKQNSFEKSYERPKATKMIKTPSMLRVSKTLTIYKSNKLNSKRWLRCSKPQSSPPRKYLTKDLKRLKRRRRISDKPATLKLCIKR